MGRNEDTVILCQDAPYVVGGLYCIFHRVAHFYYTLWNLFQTSHHGFESLVVDNGILTFTLGNDTVDVGVTGTILIM